MEKKFYKNEKFQKVFYPCALFVLICGFVASSCYLFSRRYYESIYVSGHSMHPTLLGGENDTYDKNRVHYGKADKSDRAIKTLDRFDVVITYYPKSWTASNETYIIKRLWGLPGETISLTWSGNTYKFTAIKPDGSTSISVGTIDNVEKYVTFSTPEEAPVQKKFRTCIHYAGSYGKRSFSSIKLKNDEYYVMGDNWAGSTDCYGHRSDTTYVSRTLLQGKVVQIEGTAKVNPTTKELYDKKPIKGMYNF